MRVITFHVENISRGKGRSAIQMASYCAREKLYNAYNGRTYNTPSKYDLVYNKILLPDNAPRDFLDRETLWNSVELIEKNINARLARSLYYSLPRGLDIETYISMAQNYVLDFFVNRGMCADLFIHDKGDGNPHVHTLLTTRSLNEKGEWLSKQHRRYLLHPDGTRVRDPVTNRFLLGRSIKTNDWDNHENIELWRRGWAETCNRELEHRSLEEVTHMSYARQGLNIKPTKHKGHKVIELERQGIPTDRSKENSEILMERECHRRKSEHERFPEPMYEKSR